MGFFKDLFGRSDALPAPPRPDPTTLNVWWLAGKGCFIEVVGESFRRDAIKRVAGEHGTESALQHAQAFLYPEPTNPYDANAVMVFIGGEHVGYLNRHDAPHYQPLLLELERSGYMGCCSAAIRGGSTESGYEADYGIVLYLAPGSECMVTAQPSGSFLPPEARCTVTSEQYHQEAIVRLCATGSFFYATLGSAERNPHATNETGPVVSVHAENGDVLGYLTPAMSRRHLEFVEAAQPHCEGYIHAGNKGGRDILEVELFLPLGRTVDEARSREEHEE